MLWIQDICKSYRGRRVLNHVSLRVRRGEAVGLLGRNGAGKTTVFSIITGLVEAEEGQIVLDKFNITRLPLFQRARRGIGYLPQQPSVFRGLTVEQNIMLVLEMHVANPGQRWRRLNDLLHDFHIAKLRDVKASKLSGGERRRCEIARTLASDPSFVLLDEPFAGVDPLVTSEVRQIVSNLRDRGLGVLITDHNVHEALSLVDRAYIIDSGRVLMQGTADAVLQDEEVRRLYLGRDFAMELPR